MIVFQDYMRRMLMMKCAQTLNDSKDMSVDVDDLISNHIYEVENLSDITDVGLLYQLTNWQLRLTKNIRKGRKEQRRGTR